jgi:hypothetical protein
MHTGMGVSSPGSHTNCLQLWTTHFQLQQSLPDISRYLNNIQFIPTFKRNLTEYYSTFLGWGPTVSPWNERTPPLQETAFLLPHTEQISFLCPLAWRRRKEMRRS